MCVLECECDSYMYIKNAVCDAIMLVNSISHDYIAGLMYLLYARYVSNPSIPHCFFLLYIVCLLGGFWSVLQRLAGYKKRCDSHYSLIPM